MLWYKAGVETTQCHKVPIPDGREILVCIGVSGGQGVTATDLYVEDLQNPKPALMAGDGDETFFEAFENVGGCGWYQDDPLHPFPLIRTHIDQVEFLKSKSKIKSVPTISVTAQFGKREMKPDDVEACMAHARDFLPLTKSYQINFLYDKGGYAPAPSSADTVRMFDSR